MRSLVNYHLIIHTEDYSFPGRGHHYGIYTCDHIIDVISNDKPQITIIE